MKARRRESPVIVGAGSRRGLFLEPWRIPFSATLPQLGNGVGAVTCDPLAADAWNCEVRC
jgi:hypothetical protein